MQNLSALILLRRTLAARRPFPIPRRDSLRIFPKVTTARFREKIRECDERIAVLSRAWGVSAAAAAAAAPRANGGGRDVEGVCQHTVQRMEIDSESGSGEGVHPPVQPGRHGIQDRS